MASDYGADRRIRPRNDGLFVLRPLLEGVPLAGDGSKGKIKINCVDFLDGNLYIGTSASELLHFVQIPPDPADRGSQPSFILASRPRPRFAELPGSNEESRPGVQQILLLPKVGKVCVLCNWTVTFYSLPELSPVFGTQVKNCSWIGGVDLNDTQAEHGGVTILLSLSKRIRVVRIGGDARVVKTIDYAGSTISTRRDAIACVADSRRYALIDIERQLKIPLMSISSLDPSAPAELGHAQSIATNHDGGLLRRSASTAQARSQGAATTVFEGHGRSTSLGGFDPSAPQRREQRTSDGDEIAQSPSPPPPSASPWTLPGSNGANRQGIENVPPRSATATPTPQEGLPRPSAPILRPHIASPTSEEFFVVTGTKPNEPGIGMFVNLDGDPTRPTLEFARYPLAVAVEGSNADVSNSRPSTDEEDDGYVLASLARETTGDNVNYGIEIQRWGSGLAAAPARFWLEARFRDGTGPTEPYGIRTLVGTQDMYFLELADILCRKKFSPFPGSTGTSSLALRSADSRTASSMERLSKEQELFERDFDSQEDDNLPEGWEAMRSAEELDFAKRLSGATTRLAVWTEDCVWWAIRNPLLLQLESDLDAKLASTAHGPTHPLVGSRQAVFAVLASVRGRGREARTELDLMTLNYLRQKAGVLLLMNFLQSSGETAFGATEMRAFEEVLIDSELDPRVVLALIPGLRNEIVTGRKGIWIFGGVKNAAEKYIASDEWGGGSNSQQQQHISAPRPEILMFMYRFLAAWRPRKGFGSVDDSNVFRTVDAGLLLVLLELDTTAAPGQLARSGTVRQSLYELVDKGVDCFERAVDMLETYHRLYVLSRLYQSRKMAGDVLTTWRRIIEGERDDGGEFRDGERRMRDYLGKLSNQALVQEHGLWLAGRNPRLGVQVFADEGSRATGFEAAQVVALLRKEAPDAVKFYLEYLVFGKGREEYVNDLIAYYLAVVVQDLESSDANRAALGASYEAYRALTPPKPPYHCFLADNAPPDNEAWQSRLRLLQLLGGSHDYDADAISARISQVPDGLLAPETIVLAGRKGKHEDALRLVVHGLGDYDTAVAYCLRGGSSIYGAVVPRQRAAWTRTTGSPSAAPSEQTDGSQRRRLFRVLLGEFLAITDPENRAAQTGALLERFGGWFDVGDVLALVPDEWPVSVVADFLAGALRRLVEERRGSEMTMALSSAQNVRENYELVVRMGEMGPKVEMGS